MDFFHFIYPPAINPLGNNIIPMTYLLHISMEITEIGSPFVHNTITQVAKGTKARTNIGQRHLYIESKGSLEPITPPIQTKEKTRSNLLKAI